MVQRSVSIRALVTVGNALGPSPPSFPSWPFPRPSFCCYCQLGFVNSITAFSCLMSSTAMSGLLAGIAAGSTWNFKEPIFLMHSQSFSLFFLSLIVVVGFVHHPHQVAWPAAARAGVSASVVPISPWGQLTLSAGLHLDVSGLISTHSGGFYRFSSLLHRISSTVDLIASTSSLPAFG